MTGITTEMLKGQPTFAEMSAKLTELIKKYDVKKIYTWGASDKHSLMLEKDEWKAKKMSGYQAANKWNYMELCTDISGLISGQMLGIRGGLTINMENLMYFCEIDDRQEHNALSDAFYLYKSMQYLRDYFPKEKQGEAFQKKRQMLDRYYQDRSMYNSFRRFRCSTKGCDLYHKWGKKKFEDDIRLKAFEDDLKFLKGEIPYELEFDTIQEYFQKNGGEDKVKTMAILGDSYSTYKGWIPEDYAYWYADEGNECENDMKSVTQTWWWNLVRRQEIRLLANCSYSGSTVCNTGYDAQDASKTSFIYRMKRELGEGRTTAERPDILIVFGGTNDFWAASPVGKIAYDNRTQEDLKAFAPAFCYMMEYLKRENPKSRIYNVVNDEITGEIREIMSEVCRHYDIPNIELKGIEKENGHPNVNGMAAIMEQIQKAVFH
jgi:hypothetical protein